MVPWVLWVLSALGRSVLNRRRPPAQTQKADLAVRRDHNALCAADLDHLPVHARPCRLDETAQQLYSQPAAGRAGLHSILLHATMHVAADKTTRATNCNNRSIPLRTEPTPPQQTKAPARARACQHEKTDHTDARVANTHVHCCVCCGKHSTARTSTLVAEPSSSGVGPPMRARAVAPVALQSLHVAWNTHVETCTLQHMQHAPRRMQHATPQSTGQARQ